MRAKTWLSACTLLFTLGMAGCSTTSSTYSGLDEDGFTPPDTKKDKDNNKRVAVNTNNNNKKRTFYRPQQSLEMPRAEQQTDSPMPQLSANELRLIADKIFQNEGGGNRENLVHWNDGEDFASMGVGHFTWYPAGRSARFGNTFPDLLAYMQARGVQLPGWLQQAQHQGAPWRSKNELMYAKQTGQVQELQSLLYATRLLQANYIVDRTRRAMPRLVKATTSDLRSRVAHNLNAVANTPGGWYVLIDYTNFKGEGLNRNGGYRGQNWGMLQVLEEMEPVGGPGPQALQEFANAASRVLVRRVRNSPPARNEARWLAGWSNRINTYRTPAV